VLGVLLHPYLPTSTVKLLDALGAPETSLDAAEFGRGEGGRAVSKIDPLFPKR
jgi:methionyl-tRNA synthetase